MAMLSMSSTPRTDWAWTKSEREEPVGEPLLLGDRRAVAKLATHAATAHQFGATSARGRPALTPPEAESDQENENDGATDTEDPPPALHVAGGKPEDEAEQND